MLCYVMLCYVMLCYVMLCYVMLCYIILYYIILYYIILYYIILYYNIILHTYITICIARCVDSTEYMSNQRRWRQSLGGQLLASKVISFQLALQAVQ